MRNNSKSVLGILLLALSVVNFSFIIASEIIPKADCAPKEQYTCLDWGARACVKVPNPEPCDKPCYGCQGGANMPIGACVTHESKDCTYINLVDCGVKYTSGGCRQNTENNSTWCVCRVLIDVPDGQCNLPACVP